MGRFIIRNPAAKTPWNTGYTDKKKGTRKIFDCLFCEAANSVDVKLDKKEKIGSLQCSKCLNQFHCAIIHLDCEVDVYANWIDACEAVAKTEVEEVKEQPKENEERIERKEKAGNEAPKPVAKKRSIEPEPTKPTIKKRKLDTQAPKPVTKRISTKPATAKPLHTSLAKNDAQSKKDLELAIERNSRGREVEVKVKFQREVALAKERREKKAKERARLEAEESRKWSEVTADAVAAAAFVMMAKRSQEPVLGSSSYKATAKVQSEKGDPATDENATTEDITQIYDALFGNSSDDESATNIFDVPTPMGSPRSGPNHSEQVESTLKVEENAVELDTIVIVKASERKRCISERRRDSLDSLFGSSG